MEYTCPVCEFDRLRKPPEDYLICPSCGTQFGYSDANRTHEELRQLWIAHGKRWYSSRIPNPYISNTMTDLEITKEYLQSINVPFFVFEDDKFGRQSGCTSIEIGDTSREDESCDRVPGDETLIGGYQRFFTGLVFDSAGKLLQFGAYE